MANGFVNTHDNAMLEAAFATIPRPGTKLAAALTLALETAPEHAGPIGLGPARRWAKSFSEGAGLRAAAWRWLRPHHPRAELDQLPAIQTRSGLNHLRPIDFYDRLILACREVGEAQPRLSRYIDARVADLEFKTQRDAAAAGRVADEFGAYQRMLLAAARDTRNGSATAAQLARMALAAAGAALRATLDDHAEDECVFHANLMIPVRVPAGATIDALGEQLRLTPAANEAQWLWGGLKGPIHRLFVVVSETEGASFRGFWVPDVRRDGAALAGAPRVFVTGRAEAVVVDDLPPLSTHPDDDEVAARWRRYMKGDTPGHFDGGMFVSLPVFKKVDATQRLPEAVVNVNIVGPRVWRRAYSRPWLDQATGRVGPWAATALHAFLVEIQNTDTKLMFSAGMEVRPLDADVTYEPRLLPPKGNS